MSRRYKKNRLSFDLQFTEQLPEPDLTLPQYFANLLFCVKAKIQTIKTSRPNT